MEISKEVFDKEIEICKSHNVKSGKCAWGKCENCGAPLLLQKLYTGEIIEDSNAVLEYKDKILK